MGFDDVPCVTTYGHVVAEFSRRSILEAPVVGRGRGRLLSRLVALASSVSRMGWCWWLLNCTWVHWGHLVMLGGAWAMASFWLVPSRRLGLPLGVWLVAP